MLDAPWSRRAAAQTFPQFPQMDLNLSAHWTCTLIWQLIALPAGNEQKWLIRWVVFMNTPCLCGISAQAPQILLVGAFYRHLIPTVWAIRPELPLLIRGRHLTMVITWFGGRNKTACGWKRQTSRLIPLGRLIPLTSLHSSQEAVEAGCAEPTAVLCNIPGINGLRCCGKNLISARRWCLIVNISYRGFSRDDYLFYKRDYLHECVTRSLFLLDV